MQTKAMIKTGVEVDATSFRPDWTQRWTKAQAEDRDEGLGGDFKFKGPGWYITKHVKDGKEYVDMMLVIPTFNPDLKEVSVEEQTWLFCMYNHASATDAFNWIVNAPVKVDER